MNTYVISIHDATFMTMGFPLTKVVDVRGRGGGLGELISSGSLLFQVLRGNTVIGGRYITHS